MSMILKNLQEKAVDKLILRSFDLLNKTSNKKIIFKSPTGSGKTLMVAEYLKRFVQEKISKNPEIAIIAPRGRRARARGPYGAHEASIV